MALDGRVEGLGGTARRQEVSGVAEAVSRSLSDVLDAATRGAAAREGLLGVAAAGVLGAAAARIDAPSAPARGQTAAVPAPASPNPANPPEVVVEGTTYEIGPDRRPDIRHDNGFLQNPDDPTDPVPRPTQAPTAADREYHADELLQARGGEVLSNVPFADKVDSRLGLDHALPAYRHFLSGDGADRTFDYDSFLDDDPAGRVVRENVQRDVRIAADQLYGELDTQVSSEPGASVRFEMRSDAISVSSTDPNADYPYPRTEDWQKAIGGHAIWTGSEVTVTRLEDGRLLAEASITLHAEDRYNFNPDQQDIATGAPDALRGRLEQVGLAHQFTQTGTSELTTSWIIGDPGTTDIGVGAGRRR